MSEEGTSKLHWVTGNLRRLRRKSLVGQLVLLMLGVQILFFTSFLSLQLPTATKHNLDNFVLTQSQLVVLCLPEEYQQRIIDQFPVLLQEAGEVRYSPYVPIAPVALFLGYVLSVPLGMMAAAIYFLLGMIGPYLGVLPFAAGGGWQYYREASFGYLIGLMFGSWFAGRITLASQSSARQILAVLGGLLLIHGIGLLYLVGSSMGVMIFEGDAALHRWQPWLAESIRNLSWYALPYDVFFTFALIGVGSPFRWLVSVLTAPDIAMRPKQSWDNKLEEVSEVAV